MNKPFDMKTASLIQQLVGTQKAQIERGEMTEFESRCISANLIHILDNQAERFTTIALKNAQKFELSTPDLQFAEAVQERFSPLISLIVEQCTIESQKASISSKPTEQLQESSIKDIK